MTESRTPSTDTPATGDTDRETVVVVGKESVGKSELVSSLTGDRPTSGNFRGTTTRSERYTTDRYEFVDTPGVVLDTDTEGTRDALAQVDDDETVLLVVPATDIDDDLEDLLPLVESHLGVVAVTFWDKVEERTETRRALEELSADIGVPVVPADARTVERPMVDGGIPEASAGTSTDAYGTIMDALAQPGIFPNAARKQTGRRIEPPKTVFEWPVIGPLVSLPLLLVPAGAAVWFANTLAGELDPIVEAAFEPLIRGAERLPETARSAVDERVRFAVDGAVSVRLGRTDDAHFRGDSWRMQEHGCRHSDDRSATSDDATDRPLWPGPHQRRDGVRL